MLASFYPETHYGGAQFEEAVGDYSTCYSTQSAIQNSKSVKLASDTKSCKLYVKMGCTGKEDVVDGDQATLSITTIGSLECYKK